MDQILVMEDIMNPKYDRCTEKWNTIFAKEKPEAPVEASTGNELFDQGLQWVCAGSETVLDFGCGDGTILFKCALHGTKGHIGIDLSDKGIEKANSKKTQMPCGDFRFICGGIEKLRDINANGVDAAILSNIVDNLYPEDAAMLLHEMQRVLRVNGKVLVKLNPYITAEQIKEWDIKVIKDNLLDDGLILWNNTTAQWKEFLAGYFRLHEYQEIYFPKYQQTNRMFLLEQIKTS
ncbi:MAG TPA: class I SAM-dependent methyltransferase [Firmicutes bacterium]|jgi:ubiquinone/menaquinone biosynthesis C-methylase UbiE|nr:class I SAM-dependent methyltransferase [Bacillota bacterium]HBE07215.1 class I SAM-dependent methyltransferase [Bacillota bacterium]